LNWSEVVSRVQRALRGQVLLGYKFHTAKLGGMIHSFLKSLVRGYGEPCRPRGALSPGGNRTKIAKL
jgi:hypothetical protein